jgi:hypothetical protein
MSQTARTSGDVKIRPTLYAEQQEIILSALDAYARNVWREYAAAMHEDDETDQTPFMARFRVASDAVEIIQRAQALERGKLSRGDAAEDEG